MSLASVTGVFAGATVSSGALTLPSGSVVSFTPSSTTSPGGYEMVFGLLESLHRAIGTNYDTVSSSVTGRLTDATTLRRTYSFNVDLDFNSAAIESLNVKPE